MLLIYIIALLKLKFRKVKNNYLTWGATIYLLIPPVVYFFSGDRKEFRDVDQLKLKIGYTHVPVFKIPLICLCSFGIIRLIVQGIFRPTGTAEVFCPYFAELYDIKATNINTTVSFLSDVPAGDYVFRVAEEGDKTFDYRKLELNPIAELKQ